MGTQAKDPRQKPYSPPPSSHHCLSKGLVTKIIYLLLPIIFLHFYFFPRPIFPSFPSNETTRTIVPDIVLIPPNSTATTSSEVSSTTAVDPAPPAPKCDYSRGRWVPSSVAPLYNGTSCSTIKEGQNCMAHGRFDTGYLQWRWQPEGSSTPPGSCALPPFSPSTFLSLLSNRHLAFVGDSMARNQLESLLCLLSSHPTDPPPRLVYHSGDDNKFRRWRLDARNATVSIHWSPFLVRGREKDPPGTPGGKDYNQQYLDEVDTRWADEVVEQADIVVLSVGHWFLHPALFFEKRGEVVVGCHFCPGFNYTEVGFYEVYRKAFRTALHWLVDHQKKAEGKRKYVVATTFSPAHFEGEWDKAGACARKRPYGPEEKELEGMDAEMWQRQLEEAAAANARAEEKGGQVTVEALDVTRMALLRPDGHPGPYMNPFPFGYDGNRQIPADQRVQNDCVHWCLPGPIDAWNEVFLMMLKRWSEEAEEKQQQQRKSTQW